MAEKRRTSALAVNSEETPSKAELQRRMEETRDSISQTVDEIKDTVTEQYETVRDTVSEVLDLREQFEKNPLVWGVGAVAVGLAVGYSIALMRGGDHQHSGRRSRRTESDSLTENIFDGLATLGQSYLLPAVTHKVKELFGIDITQELLAHRTEQRETSPRKRSAKKSGAKKSSARKRAAKKVSTKKSSAK